MKLYFKRSPELLDDMDAFLARNERRYKRMLSIAKKNPKGFVAHVEKVLASIKLNDFDEYRAEILRISKRKGAEDFERHSRQLTNDSKGFYIFLWLAMEDLQFTIIAKKIDVDLRKIILRFVHAAFPDKGHSAFPDKEHSEKYKTVSVDTHKAPNDKITISVFNPSEKQWEAGKIFAFENPKGQKDKIMTPVEIMKRAGITRPDAFDRTIFNTCYSLIAGGNLATTTDIIFSHITGSEGRARPSEEMRRAIKDSIIKISTPWIRIDVESVNNAFHYGDGKKKIYEGRLLDAKFKQILINGKTVSDGITFWGKSPLVEVAESRGQIISYPKELLRVPVSATKETIAMREDLLRAVMNIMNHGTTPTILFSSVFESIGYNEMNKQQQQRTRKKAVVMMDYWREQGVFKDYRIEKDGQLPVKFAIVRKRAKK